MGAPYASHYLWVIIAFQIVAAVLLLVNRYVPPAVSRCESPCHLT
jgi:hypothetical protein